MDRGPGNTRFRKPFNGAVCFGMVVIERGNGVRMGRYGVIVCVGPAFGNYVGDKVLQQGIDYKPQLKFAFWVIDSAFR
jgi:hypothetical protein